MSTTASAHCTLTRCLFCTRCSRCLTARRQHSEPMILVEMCCWELATALTERVIRTHLLLSQRVCLFTWPWISMHNNWLGNFVCTVVFSKTHETAAAAAHDTVYVHEILSTRAACHGVDEHIFAVCWWNMPQIWSKCVRSPRLERRVVRWNHSVMIKYVFCRNSREHTVDYIYIII